jgi:hypothetical protein
LIRNGAVRGDLRTAPLRLAPAESAVRRSRPFPTTSLRFFALLAHST